MIDILSLNNGVAISSCLQSATCAISEMFRKIKVTVYTITWDNMPSYENWMTMSPMFLASLESHTLSRFFMVCKLCTFYLYIYSHESRMYIISSKDSLLYYSSVTFSIEDGFQTELANRPSVTTKCKAPFVHINRICYKLADIWATWRLSSWNTVSVKLICNIAGQLHQHFNLALTPWERLLYNEVVHTSLDKHYKSLAKKQWYHFGFF